jgi:plasmid stabilization system protein ParE
MNFPVILRPAAEADVADIYDYLEDARAGLGKKFLARLREVLERLESFPLLYGIVWRDVRAARLRRFRYVVYYVAFADRVEVLAVLHGARDESAWKARAK